MPRSSFCFRRTACFFRIHNPKHFRAKGHPSTFVPWENQALACLGVVASSLIPASKALSYQRTPKHSRAVGKPSMCVPWCSCKFLDTYVQSTFVPRDTQALPCRGKTKHLRAVETPKALRDPHPKREAGTLFAHRKPDAFEFWSRLNSLPPPKKNVRTAVSRL